MKMQKLDKTIKSQNYFLRSVELEITLNTILKIIDNQNLRMIQLGENPMFSLVCATYSILHSCICVVSKDNIEINLETLEFYEKDLKQKTEVLLTQANCIPDGDFYVIFDNTYLNQYIETRDSQKAIVLISSNLLQKSEDVEVFSILSLNITERESLNLYKSQSLICQEFQDYEKYCRILLEVEMGGSIDDELFESFSELAGDRSTELNVSDMLSLHDEIINTIHYSFIKTSEYYQQTLRNKTVVKYFITAYAILIKVLTNENSPENELLLEKMSTRNIVSWCLISLVFNLDLAALLITAAHEYLVRGLRKGLLFFDTIHRMCRVRVSDMVKTILQQSYAVITRREGMLHRCCKPNSGNGLMEYSEENLIDEEEDSLIGLIPDYVLLFDNSISLAGKTSLGGLIAMKNALYNTSNPISFAGVIYVLRHEISCKKRMLHGSGCLYLILLQKSLIAHVHSPK